MRRSQNSMVRMAFLENVRPYRCSVRHRPAPQWLYPAQRVLRVCLSTLTPQVCGEPLEHARTHDGLEAVGADEEVAGRRCAVLKEQPDRCQR